MTMIGLTWLTELPFPMVSMISIKTQAMSKLGPAETPQNLPVTPSIIGGLTTVVMTIPRRPQFCSCVMRVEIGRAHV